MVFLVFTAACYYLNFGFDSDDWEDEHFYASIVALLGAAVSVPLSICNGFTIPVSGWISYILVILLMGVVAFAQVAIYGRILGYYDSMTRGGEQERVGGLTLCGAGIIGVIRAICELADWHFPDFLTTCFMLGIALLSVLIIIPGFESENYGTGLLMALIVVPIVTCCFTFSVVMIMMATFGILIAILVLCALAMPSGGGSSSYSSSSSSGGGGYSGPDIHYGKSGHYIDSRHFREDTGQDCYRQPDGTWCQY